MNEPPARRVALRSRPVRVAYLVELSEESHLLLDAIFDESKSWWGGRFSLIVPCETGSIRETYSNG